ncbi:MAG: MarR family transcriptional regulator [Myxococcales bacterium]|nr:MarR family transcriptional regulator [Myxococcales bacterium]
MSSTPIEEAILRALRRITRSIDLHSRKLASTFGLTGPQLICLRALGQVEYSTPSALAKELSLSQATVTGIVDRLDTRQLLVRERSMKDRRLVTVTITEAGRALIEQAPYPLQESFVERLLSLPAQEQANILNTLEQVVQMMGGEDIKAAAVLSTSSTPVSTEEVGVGIVNLSPELLEGTET